MRREASLAKIHIENRIEDRHLQRGLVEDVLRDTLRDFVGRWHVLIRQAQTDPWWVVLLERDGELEPEGGVLRRTLLLDPTAQKPEALRKTIEEALRGAA